MFLFKKPPLLAFGFLLLLNACGGGGGSGTGNDDSSNTAPDATTDTENPTVFDLVALSSIDASKLTVDWTPASDNVTSPENFIYDIHVSESTGFRPSSASLNTSTTGSTTTELNGLTASTLYYVRVVAKDEAGNESWSNELNASSVSLAISRTPNTVNAIDSTETVTADTLTYTSSTEPEVGSILVSQEGEGYLRKVVSSSIDGGQVTVQTSNASLNEVFEDISISSSVRLVSTELSTGARTSELASKIGIQAYRTSSTTREIIWESGLKISEEGSGLTQGVRANKLIIDGAIQTEDQNEASFTGPSIYAGQPGETLSFDLAATIKNDKYEVCDIRLVSFDSDRSSPSVGAIQNINGASVAQATWSPTAEDESDDPYYAVFKAYIDKKTDSCNGDNLTSVWSAILDLRVPYYVVQGLSAAIDKEERNLSFDGGFTVTNDLTIDFIPTFNVNAKIEKFKLQTAEMSIEADIIFQNELNINAQGTATLDKTVPVLLERKFTKIYMAGYVPIIVKGKFKIDGHITGTAHGEINLNKTIRLEFPDASFGLEYDRNNGGWGPVKNFDTEYQFSIDGEGSAGAEIQLALKPDMQISFYDAATGRLIVEPYLYAETAFQGELTAISSSDGSAINADYWFDELVAGAGVNLYLWAGLSILDYEIASYPNNVGLDETDQFQKFTPIDKTPIWGLPTLSATQLPGVPTGFTDSRSFSIQGSAEDLPNPFGSESLNPFLEWDFYKVLKEVNGLYVETTDSTVQPVSVDNGEFVFRYNLPGAYKVRLAGHSTAGSFFRQIADVDITISDADADGMADQWEAIWSLSDPNADPDGDGITNLEEYQNGGDPIVVNATGVVPAAPTNVNTNTGDGLISLSWDAVQGAPSYDVYIAKETGLISVNYASYSGGTVYQSVMSPLDISGLSNGTTYYSVVTASNNIGISPDSQEVSATPSISSPPLDLTQGLVAHYEFEGNAIDSSGNGNGGTENGGVTYTAGVTGQAASFDGVDDYIEVVNPVNFDTSLSVSGFYYLNSSANNTWYALFNKDNYCQANGTFGASYNKSTNQIRLYNGDNCLGIRTINYNFQTDTWVNITFSYNGVTFKTYINGGLIDSFPYSLPISDEANLYIGVNPNPSTSFPATYFWDGLMDEIRIYNRALSVSEIQQLGLASLSSGLVAHYEFEGNANDSSGNGNDGTENGGVTYTSGVSGQAASFDGVDDFIRNEGISINSAEMSFSAWVKPQDIPSWYRSIVSLHSGENGYIDNGDKNISLWTNSNSSFLGLYAPENGTTGEAVEALPSLETGKWHHVSYVRTNTLKKIFINGVEVSTSRNDVTHSNPLVFTNGLIDIGAPNYYGSGNGWSSNGRGDAKWKGDIDELRIYNRALSESEIQELAGGSLTSTVVYSEDFSSDAQFTNNTVNVYQDADETYYAKVYDVSTGIGKDMGLSPVFTEAVSPSTQSFTVEFDVNPINPDWGTYPQIWFIDDSQFDINAPEFLGRSFSFCMCWEDSGGKNFRLLPTATNAGNSISPTLNIENVWYHVTISFDNQSQTFDFKITLNSDGSVFHADNGIEASGIGNFNRIAIGGWQVGPKYGSFGEIKFDNIVITK
jgi:hypothetical protein